MANYNFINYNSKIDICTLCKYDANISYETDFSTNGDVDGWDYFSGIHTYGCWNNCLFGTLYANTMTIGRYYNILPFDGETYYTVIITMLVKIVDRNSVQTIPNLSKFMWVTLEDSDWDEEKSLYFTVFSDNDWHTYSLDLSSKQKWVGNISNIRISPIYADGMDGDEFLLKTIQVRSINTYTCMGYDCSYHSGYVHPCKGIGERSSCTSDIISCDYLDIIKDYNDYIILNINGYGEEIIKIKASTKVKLSDLANRLTIGIGSIAVGGYAEASVVYESNRFIIYSGDYNSSTIQIYYTKLFENLGFFNSSMVSTYVIYTGCLPASRFVPTSSFKITPSQLIDLIDNNTGSYVEFDPSSYNVEGGRRDWFQIGLGVVTKTLGGAPQDYSRVIERSFVLVGEQYKTLVDFNHPFNATGRITNIYLCGTCDYGFEQITGKDGGTYRNGEWGMGRLYTKDIKIKIFRPKKDGTLQTVHEILIPDRPDASTTLISKHQNSIEVDCDFFVNKGDLLGVYNVFLYAGKSICAEYVDASYFIIDGDIPVGTLVHPGDLQGEGNSGLLMYARSNQKQTKLKLSVDFNNRINIGDLLVKGIVTDEDVEYNIMRCLDIDWDINLFGGKHTTEFEHLLDSRKLLSYNVPNVYYGKDKLTDGIYTVNNGVAADAFAYIDPMQGVVPTNPYYFFVNGDQEWFQVHYWPEYWRGTPQVFNFKRDPISFTVTFPREKLKTIHKSVVYFLEPYNFRSFALSTYLGPVTPTGNADDPNYLLIPEYISVKLDGIKYDKTAPFYLNVDKYLFVNPTIGHMIHKILGGPGLEYPGDAILPGGWTYTMYQTILNMDQHIQAINIDWKTIEHIWEPISCYGFRFYCDYHESTKICEMELYGYIKGGAAKISAGVNIATSFYGDEWNIQGVEEVAEGEAACAINDTIRYIDIEITPLNNVILQELSLTVNNESVFFGKKGCEDVLFLDECSLSGYNKANCVDIKNIYGNNSSVYVDILNNNFYEKKTLYYSSLGSDSAVVNPEIGPGAVYKKSEDYPLLNQNNNVAINCNCYGLDNIVINKKAYYSYDNGFSWISFNNSIPLTSSYINFSNLPYVCYSAFILPVLNRNKYWRIRLKGYDNVLGIIEIKVYKNNNIIPIKQIYHDKQANVNYTRAQRIAPHLINGSVTGSFYKLKNDEFITIELYENDYIDKIVFFHNSTSQYASATDVNRFCGVDRYTLLYITNNEETIYDYSYYERNNIYNNNVIISKDSYQIGYSKVYDFSNDPSSYFDFITNSSFTANYILPSGTLASGTYEYPGYLDSNLSLDIHLELPICYSRLSTSSDIFYYVHGFNNAAFEVRAAISSSSSVSEIMNAIMVGFMSKHNDSFIGWEGSMFGASFSISPHGFGIVITQWDAQVDSITYPYSVVTDFIYYYVFASDGAGTYTLKVYTDAFNGSNKVCDLQIVSHKQWESLYFGISRAPQIATLQDSLCGKFYYISLTGSLFQNDTLSGQWEGSLLFDSAKDSYLSLPYESVFNFSKKKFSIDFMIKLKDLPYGVRDISDSNVDLYPYGVVFKETGRYGWEGYFDGFAYISAANNSIFNLADENFTIDFLVRFTAVSPRFTFFYRANSYKFYYDVSTLKLKFDGYQNGIVNPNVSAEVYYEFFFSKTYHVAITRANNLILIFVDGVLLSPSSSITGAIDFPSSISTSDEFMFYIGASVSGTVADSLRGYMEEFRITKGIDRWSESFTVPQALYTTDANTYLISRFGREYIVCVENYDNSITAPAEKKAWSLRIIQHGVGHVAQFVYNSTKHIFNFFYDLVGGNTYTSIKRELWYHIALSVGLQGEAVGYRTLDISVNGKVRFKFLSPYVSSITIAPGYNSIIIGKYLTGNIKNIRISSTDTALVSDLNGIRYPFLITASYDIPILGYSRLYTVSIYNSEDNSIYGFHSDIDLYKNSEYSYFFSDNTFSSSYSALFAIDLNKKYDIGIIRSYGATQVAPFGTDTNVYYSNLNTSDVTSIFSEYLFTEDLFEQQNFSKDLSNWALSNTISGSIFVKDELLMFKVNGGNVSVQTASAISKYMVKDSFELQFDYGISLSSMLPWTFEFIIYNFNNNTQAVKFERGQLNGQPCYSLSIQDLFNTVYTLMYSSITFDTIASIKIVRYTSFFIFYKKNPIDLDWIELFRYSITTDYWEYSYFKFELKSLTPGFPEVEFYLDNIKLNTGKAIFNDKTEARWVVVHITNGDNISKVVNKIGIYSNIQTLSAPGGGANNSWTPLGYSITSYTGDVNLAYGATVSGSSYFAGMYLDNIVNGSKDFGTNLCWGSAEGDLTPTIVVDLGAIYSIYRIKLFHGLYAADTKYLLKNYTVSYSTDAINYSTFVTISNNTLFERTHDANPYFIGRYIKLYISSFYSSPVSIYNYTLGVFETFYGAVLREMEVYKYNGQFILSSEEYPIVAIDLGQSFYLTSNYSIVGVDLENQEIDWDTDPNSFCYSRQGFDIPSKLTFFDWGGLPDYNRWVVIKKDTATGYANGPHFIKNIIVRSVDKESIIAMSSWWGSTLSTLSKELVLGELTNALTITYPSSTLEDRVFFTGGTDFGIDAVCSWRDCFYFRFYINNVENINLDYGYFYFSGYDGTEQHSPVVYKWNIARYKDILSNGVTWLMLRFKNADQIEYANVRDYSDIAVDNSKVSSITWTSIGIVFKGTASGTLVMGADSFYIHRNHFIDYTYNGYGLYLNASDYLTIPISAIKGSALSIAFWIRPDYNSSGLDIYNDNKVRNIFSIGNNNNDIMGLLVVNDGLVFYMGNILTGVRSVALNSTEGLFNIDDVFHFALSASNNGLFLDSYGNTLRMYINNKLIFTTAETWDISDSKHFKFILGGNPAMSQVMDTIRTYSSVDAVISNLRIYNYCKTDFRDDMEINYKEGELSLYESSEFIEVSKDNVTFYKAGAVELPLVFKEIDYLSSVKIYIKSNFINKTITGRELRTAGLLLQWDINV